MGSSGFRSEEPFLFSKWERGAMYVHIFNMGSSDFRSQEPFLFLKWERGAIFLQKYIVRSCRLRGEEPFVSKKWEWGAITFKKSTIWSHELYSCVFWDSISCGMSFGISYKRSDEYGLKPDSFWKIPCDRPYTLTVDDLSNVSIMILCFRTLQYKQYKNTSFHFEWQHVNKDNILLHIIYTFHNFLMLQIILLMLSHI